MASESSLSPLRPPAVPLVAHDPYFSIWSPADKLTDADTTHWTGHSQRLTTLVRIDGKAFRLMGKEPASVSALPQTAVEVLPTRTIYSFEGEGVKLSLTFMTPALPDDLEVLSRPVTYVVYEFQSADGKTHDTSFELSANGELAVNQPDQLAIAAEDKIGKLAALRIGSKDQPMLAKKGDDIRIDWGYLYLAADPKVATGSLNVKVGEVVAANKIQAVFTSKPVKVSSKPVSRWLMLAYDDEYSIQYMKKNLRPYWRRNGDDAAALLKKAAADYESLKVRCERFDAELMADLRAVGGEKYARLAALAFRQCFAAGKFVADANGQPLSFCKENHSNGCIGTSDVFYPMSPQFLLFGPSMAKSFLVPFMDYAASERWRFPFAPHDLGTYPHANGQVYGDGESGVNNQMPVEESGNLLILLAAVAQMEGNADFAGRYWKQLETWAQYLKEKGFDPENQLCTDDFAGHLAHNVNLSTKAICGLGSFAKLCEMRGEKHKSAEYFKLAREFAARWVKEAKDGDHYRLAFDKAGSWSQKYNLVWDRILGLNLFPDEVARTEMDYYKRIQNQYGLPLDNRATYTKLDWTVWTATLTQNRADFEAVIAPVYAFLNATPDRSPMTDWYETKSAKKVGFTARPVVGGVFIPLLYDQALWSKYAGREKTKAANWSPIPKRPKITTVIPAGDKAVVMWRYTSTAPGEGLAWTKAGFDDSGWSVGPGGFGADGSQVKTKWNTKDIWLRREVELTAEQIKQVSLWLFHDDEVAVYINGELVKQSDGWTLQYEDMPLDAQARKALKPGKNQVAIHCQQHTGWQFIDLGFVVVEPAE